MSFPALVEPAAELTIDEVRRYSRHLIIPDVGMTGQKRLKNAKVLVIGAGGLGSPALLYLAAAGVGTLGIAEFDEVDESNLQRQIIHGQSDIGKSKADSARESIAETNPLVNVVVHDERLDNDNVLRRLRGLRPDRRRHRQLRDALHGQRRGVLPEDPLRLGLDLPLRRPGLGVLADAPRRRRPVLPLPLPRAPAAGHGAVAAPRAACSACSAPASARSRSTRRSSCSTGIGEPLVGRLMIYDALEMEYRKLQGPQGPELRALRREPDRHRADRLRDVLRRDLRRGRRRGRRLDDLGDPARAHAQGARGGRPATSCWSTSASPTSTRSTRSPARC